MFRNHDCRGDASFRKETAETSGESVLALDKQVEIFKEMEEQILGRGRISIRKCRGVAGVESYY